MGKQPFKSLSISLVVVFSLLPTLQRQTKVGQRHQLDKGKTSASTPALFAANESLLAAVRKKGRADKWSSGQAHRKSGKPPGRGRSCRVGPLPKFVEPSPSCAGSAGGRAIAMIG